MAFNNSPNYAGSYLGVRATNPPNFVQSNFRPGPNNWQNVVVGDLWLYIPDPTSSANREIYMLVSLVANSALWVPLSGSTGTMLGTVTDDLLIETPDPVLGLISLAGDGNIVTSQGGSHEALFSLAPSITVQTLNARNNTASANAPALVNFIKTRNNGPVNSGDDIGCLNWFGFDTNSNPILTAQICTYATGVGVNQMGGIMRFYTTPVIPLTSPRQRIEIDQTGIVSINQADADTLDFDTPSFFVDGSSVISQSTSTTAATGAFTTLLRTHGAGAIVSGDQIGIINFAARDTNGSIVAGGSIKSISSGTIAPSRVAGNLVFGTHPDIATNELTRDRMQINSAGTVIINTSDNDTYGVSTINDTLTVTGTGNISVNNNNDLLGALAQVVKTTSNGGTGPITSGSVVGTFNFVGYDSTSAPVAAAAIKSTCSGTISGANRVAGNLQFFTHPDNAVSATPTLRMTIAPTGTTTIAAPDSGVALTVSGQVSVGGDTGSGTASNVDLTNVTNLTANGAGTFTIASKSANPATSAGFLKIYFNGTAYWIPLFTNPAP